MIENRINEHREKENMLKCLELADKGKHFEIQKKQQNYDDEGTKGTQRVNHCRNT
jgi:hypothetical protein